MLEDPHPRISLVSTSSVQINPEDMFTVKQFVNDIMVKLKPEESESEDLNDWQSRGSVNYNNVQIGVVESQK